jgi:hypothetical protein
MQSEHPMRVRVTSSFHTDTFSLTAGQCLLQWPANMTLDDLDTMTEWMAIVMRKITRITQDRQGASETPPPAASEGETHGTDS